MAKNIKLTQEELKTDEVAEFVEKLTGAYARNRSTILIALIVFAVLGISFSIYSNSRQRRLVAHSQVVNRAAILFEQLPAMQDYAEAELQINGMIEDLDKVIAQQGDSNMGRNALYLKANVHYYAGTNFLNTEELDNAEAAFEVFLRSANSPMEEAQANISLGNTLENQYFLTEDQNKFIRAQAYYDDAIEVSDAGSYLYYDGLMNKARLLELSFQDAEALAIYEQVLAERPPTSVRDEETDENQNALHAFIKEQIAAKMEPFSFHATAKLRSDLLKATSRMVIAPVTEPDPDKSDDGSDDGL